MALVNVLREPNADGVRLPGEMDESELTCTIHVARDDDDMRIVWTEHCKKGCTGLAHASGIADNEMAFCSLHLKHSVDVTMKRWPHEMTGAVQQL